jgi:hypothetical protein
MITSNSYAEMADAVRRMAELSEIAPPRTLGLPEPQMVRGGICIANFQAPGQTYRTVADFALADLLFTTKPRPQQ